MGHLETQSRQPSILPNMLLISNFLLSMKFLGIYELHPNSRYSKIGFAGKITSVWSLLLILDLDFARDSQNTKPIRAYLI